MENKKKNEELQSRRQFFKRAAKGALPILGAIALSQVPFLSQAHKSQNGWGCDWGCSNGCFSSCTGCTGGCSGSCRFNCSSTCQGQCYNSCYGTCQGGCARSAYA
ncbi:MAG: Cys-Xaa-Xaa-Xaa repeat radical SAM target protein [Muribaculaceae bacterium]|nr:Cys-Xaa-Xaa-Xaa repeat radical SAM target protein [Muribaculaceae bacterium]